MVEILKKDVSVVLGVELLWGAWFQTRHPTTRKRGKGSGGEGDKQQKKYQRLIKSGISIRAVSIRISSQASSYDSSKLRPTD